MHLKSEIANEKNISAHYFQMIQNKKQIILSDTLILATIANRHP